LLYNALTTCDRGAGELRYTLLEFETGAHSSSVSGGVVRKITPVTTKQLQQQQQQDAVDRTNELSLQVGLPVYAFISQNDKCIMCYKCREHLTHMVD